MGLPISNFSKFNCSWRIGKSLPPFPMRNLCSGEENITKYDHEALLVCTQLDLKQCVSLKNSDEK